MAKRKRGGHPAKVAAERERSQSAARKPKVKPPPPPKGIPAFYREGVVRAVGDEPDAGFFIELRYQRYLAEKERRAR